MEFRRAEHEAHIRGIFLRGREETPGIHQGSACAYTEKGFAFLSPEVIFFTEAARRAIIERALENPEYFVSIRVSPVL